MASGSKTTSDSESSSARHWKYDVFLSFRGPDTRRSIAAAIYEGLQNRDIKCFKDDPDLDVGDPISQTLLTAIEESKFAVVVLSPNYASSPWCLEELVKICQCMKDNNRILPLFYKVYPADVRHQKGTFEVAFAEHGNSRRYKSEEVQQWRDALKKVASFSGWNTDEYKTDSELVKAVVNLVCTKVVPTAFHSTEDFTVFEATRQAMNQVMMALNDTEVTVIGVHGMGGVGKTTLVKHVGQEVRKHFDHVIIVRVNQNSKLNKVQDTMAAALGIKLPEETEDHRVSRLTEEIKSKNKILIILDNVWDRINLPSIGIPNCDKSQTCNTKVLLTTRRLHICHVMNSKKNISLDYLSEEDSWTLFVKHARRSFDSTDFDVVARKVAKECGGLPIALIAVARALGDKDLTDWERAAEQLEKSQPAHIDQDEAAFECIKLSYDFLKDEDSKSCFLLCCLFPEDYDIEIQDLFKYGIGKGLFQSTDGPATIKDARGKAVAAAKHLIHSNMLLDSEFDGCVRLHAFIRDTAIRIARSDEHSFLVKAGCGSNKFPGQFSETFSIISLMGNDIRELPEELVCPKLQILLLQENYDLNQIPDTFFKDASLLRVMDLSYTSITSLSKSFINLSNLQGLYLDYCHNITDFSILKFFKKLEILSMKEYPLKELSTEIGKLTTLRVLDVSGGNKMCSKIITVPYGVISKLQKLEELCLQCGFWDWGSKVEGKKKLGLWGSEMNVSFDEVTNLPNLDSLKVLISDADCIPKRVRGSLSWTCFDICICRYSLSRTIIRNLHIQNGHKYSRSLVLDTTINILPAWFLRVVTMNIERLVYVDVEGLNDILLEYHRGGLHSLKHLAVLGPNVSLETLFLLEAIPASVRNNPVFEKLEELQLKHMDSLKELCLVELPSRSLQNLKLLEVLDCPRLENVLLPSKLLKRLANLEKLSCCTLPGIEYVFGCEGFELQQSKLRDLKLVDLDVVKGICCAPAPPAMFQALISLYIFGCNFQGCLFTFDVAQCLVHLEDIYIEGCPKLEGVIETWNKSEPSKKTVLPKLKSLVLMKLPMLYSGSATINIECPSLEHFYVKECPHLDLSPSDYNFGSQNTVKVNESSRYTLKFVSLTGGIDQATRKDVLSIQRWMKRELQPAWAAEVNEISDDTLDEDARMLRVLYLGLSKAVNMMSEICDENVAENGLSSENFMDIPEIKKTYDMFMKMGELYPAELRQEFQSFLESPNYENEMEMYYQILNKCSDYFNDTPELFGMRDEIAETVSNFLHAMRWR